MKLPSLSSIKKIGRPATCILLLIVIFIAYEIRLAEWQIVRGDEFQAIARNSNTDTMELSAARGEILDQNGIVLAGNRVTYNIIYNASTMIYAERNATIVRVISLLTQQGETWRDILPIQVDDEGNYFFPENREEDIADLKEFFSLADYATADDCMNALISQYSCSGYSKEDTRVVAAVRYSMTRDGYSPTNPYVIATGVSVETVGILSQREAEFVGIEAQVAVSRYYGEDGALAPHVVGNIGSISEEQYQAAVEAGKAYDSQENPSGYRWTDVRGQTGIESAFEDELRGQRGTRKVTASENVVTQAPQEGNTVRLTLDAKLQQAANFSLKENVEGNTLAADCVAGAAVVLDVEDFGVLASASYPSYDLNLYTVDNDYVLRMNTDEDTPLVDRALTGRYVPGSTFKPMVALAGLQEQVISASTTLYNCNGKFEYFDLDLGCTGTHGYANVYEALASSCNAFFCQLGLDLSIAKMDAYAEYFALGQRTGVELPEGTGTMSNPQEYEENHPGVVWTDGLSAQTAIGQCDNIFTPLQLATYCATIANGGQRLRTHFLDEILDYSGETVISSYEPEVISDAGLSADVLNVVREGMVQVASSANGTAYTTFGDYPIAIAAKTGTAETSDAQSEPNLTFIAYAPAYAPEIAVAVVMEKGYKGAYAQRVAKDILDVYFGYTTWDDEGNRYDQEGNQIDGDGRILKTAEEVAQANSTPAPTASPSPEEDGNGASAPGEPTEPSSGDRDDGIPDAPFVGASPSPSPTPDPSSSPSPDASPSQSSGPDSPFWSGP